MKEVEFDFIGELGGTRTLDPMIKVIQSHSNARFCPPEAAGCQTFRQNPASSAQFHGWASFGRHLAGDVAHLLAGSLRRPPEATAALQIASSRPV